MPRKLLFIESNQLTRTNVVQFSIMIDNHNTVILYYEKPIKPNVSYYLVARVIYAYLAANPNDVTYLYCSNTKKAIYYPVVFFN